MILTLQEFLIPKPEKAADQLRPLAAPFSMAYLLVKLNETTLDVNRKCAAFW